MESSLTLLDSGSIRVSTTLVGASRCEAGTVFARVTYVDDDGDRQETSAFGVESVTYTFEAPSASNVSSVHSVRYEEGCIPDEGTCQSPEYRLGSK